MDPVSLKLLVLRTSNLQALKSFFEAVGLVFSEEQHGRGPVHFAAKAGAAVLEVYPLQEGAKGSDPSLRLGFAVQDLGKTLSALSRLDTCVKQPPEHSQWGYRAIVQDPDGRIAELTQEV
jgi:predicted enzyme related to lactoylglutathione lyase